MEVLVAKRKRKLIVKIRLYPREGDWEKNEFHVYAYFSLTSPKSRCQIKNGELAEDSPPTGHVAKPKRHPIESQDMLEYMPNNNDLLILLEALQKADELRELRRQLKNQGVDIPKMVKRLKEKVRKFHKEVIDRFEKRAEKEKPKGISLDKMLEEIGYIKRKGG
jgi:hypothetical protein